MLFFTVLWGTVLSEGKPVSEEQYFHPANVKMMMAKNWRRGCRICFPSRKNIHQVLILGNNVSWGFLTSPFSEVSHLGKISKKARCQSPHFPFPSFWKLICVLTSTERREGQDSLGACSSVAFSSWHSLTRVFDQLPSFRFHSTLSPRNSQLPGCYGVYQISLVSQDPEHQAKI